ncbi:MAG: FeoB-associated Cys-rich membrane protein [Bacteroidales bacterium]|nr:FeoB-associated Cys-rich membrane protein [Bacteroidales bacterium]
MNAASIVILILILAAVGAAIYAHYKQKKSGKCSCGCDGCQYRGSCSTENSKFKEQNSDHS